jgi:hypothetical protein
MTPPKVVNGWGLVRVNRRAEPECLTVKADICDLPPYTPSARYPLYKVVVCPGGVHGSCGGGFPCLR